MRSYQNRYALNHLADEAEFEAEMSRILALKPLLSVTRSKAIRGNRKDKSKGKTETEIKLNEGTYETLGNGGTDAQFRCRRHLCAIAFRRPDGFGYGGEQHGPTNARLTCF